MCHEHDAFARSNGYSSGELERDCAPSRYIMIDCGRFLHIYIYIYREIMFYVCTYYYYYYIIIIINIIIYI